MHRCPGARKPAAHGAVHGLRYRASVPLTPVCCRPSGIRRALLAGVLAALWALAGCTPGSRELETRAVVIGIDGADWKLIDALAAEGELPNLTGLRERGVWGPIETLRDVPLSPVIWTSGATGGKPTKHGSTWFLVDQPDGTRVPVRSHNRKTEASGNILA